MIGQMAIDNYKQGHSAYCSLQKRNIRRYRNKVNQVNCPIKTLSRSTSTSSTIFSKSNIDNTKRFPFDAKFLQCSGFSASDSSKTASALKSPGGNKQPV